MEWPVICFDTSQIESPDALGELLRDWFFKGEGLGRPPTSDYDFREEVECVGWTTVCGEYRCPVYKRESISMTWFSDGDTILIFKLPDGTYLENWDAKKDHGWRFTDSV